MKKITIVLLAVFLLSGCKIVRSIGETVGLVEPEKTEVVVIDPNNTPPPTVKVSKVNLARVVTLCALLVGGLIVARYALKRYHAEVGQVDNDKSQSD